VKSDSATGERIAKGLLAAAVLFALARHPALRLGEFAYPHDWVTAHFAVIARAFVDTGLWALAGVPLQNYPPLTADPDTYLNWPPLFSWLLSGVVFALGDSERVIHGAMLALHLATAGLLARIGARLRGGIAGAFAAATWLLLPVSAHFSQLALPLHLALPLGLVALERLLAWLEAPDGGARAPWTAGVAFALAALASWEPLLMAPGIALALFLARDARAWRATLVLGAAGAAAVLATFGLYAAASPRFAADLRDIALLRAGLAELDLREPRVHELYRLAENVSALAQYPRRYLERLALLGPAPVLGALWALASWLAPAGRKRVAPAVAIASLASMWGLWALLMRRHYYVHAYQMAIAGPLCALGVAAAASELVARARTAATPGARNALTALACVALPLALAAPRAWMTVEGSEPGVGASPLVEYGRSIERGTPAGAVVLATEPSMVPVYYAHRHLIRGVSDEGLLARHLERVRAVAQGAPVYLAIPGWRMRAFERSLARYPTVHADRLGVVLLLSDAVPSPP
jgi:4-amino-4-deoxy-L-arabinose transferase-like glycosyltransferase